MLGRSWSRTGIDLGTRAVKLVRSQGGARIERVTHAGEQEWDAGGADRTARAARALSRLLARLRLRRGRLGRIAVSVWDSDCSLRDVTVSALDEAELRRALPFEAKRHLFVDNLVSPVFDCQILAAAVAANGGTPSGSHAVMAAVSGPVRDFPLQVLARCGLEPEVVDLEPLAGFNALLPQCPFAGHEEDAVGLLDLGAAGTYLHLMHKGGGLFSREIDPKLPSSPGRAEQASGITPLAAGIRETITFYRGRSRREVRRIFLSGGGSLQDGLEEALSRALERPVAVLRPFNGLQLSALAAREVAGREAGFVIAAGLCRWWDGADV